MTLHVIVKHKDGIVLVSDRKGTKTQLQGTPGMEQTFVKVDKIKVIKERDLVLACYGKDATLFDNYFRLIEEDSNITIKNIKEKHTEIIKKFKNSTAGIVNTSNIPSFIIIGYLDKQINIYNTLADICNEIKIEKLYEIRPDSGHLPEIVRLIRMKGDFDAENAKHLGAMIIDCVTGRKGYYGGVGSLIEYGINYINIDKEQGIGKLSMVPEEYNPSIYVCICELYKSERIRIIK